MEALRKEDELASRVVLDIETVPVDWTDFDEEEQAYLLKSCENEEEEARERERLGLFPLTGRIVAIGMLNPESDKAMVLAEGLPGEGSSWEPEEGVEYWTGNEMEMLERFWDVVKRYQQIITFNGRTFDGPYLMLRSLLLGVAISRNLVPSRYKIVEHFDLLDVLSFFGATRRYSLDFLCRRTGLKSSKTKLTGARVAEAYQEGRVEEIARYCLEDVRATGQLLQRVQETMGTALPGM